MNGSPPAASAAREPILREIASSGPITFRRFMELALYHPAAGYYRRGPFPGRDYITAPEISPLFGRLIGRFVAKAASLLPGSGPLPVVELGAGSGRFAAALASSPELAPAIERGEVLHVAVEIGYAREGPRHRGPFHPLAAEGLAPFRQLERAVVLANEFFDALPCAVAEFRDGRFREVMVASDGDRLLETFGEPVTPGLGEYIASRRLPQAEGARFEFGPAAREVIFALGYQVRRGLLLTMDYGGAAAELASRAAGGGTLRSFSAHTVLAGPLESPGSADITADVNFDDLAAWGEEAGWEAVHEGSQRDFLIMLGLLDELVALACRAGDKTSLAEYLAAKRFLLEEGLQERFRVQILGRALSMTAVEAADFLLDG